MWSVKDLWSQDDPKTFGFSNYRMDLLSTEMWRAPGGAGLGLSGLFAFILSPITSKTQIPPPKCLLSLTSSLHHSHPTLENRQPPSPSHGPWREFPAFYPGLFYTVSNTWYPLVHFVVYSQTDPFISWIMSLLCLMPLLGFLVFLHQTPFLGSLVPASPEASSYSPVVLCCSPSYCRYNGLFKISHTHYAHWHLSARSHLPWPPHLECSSSLSAWAWWGFSYPLGLSLNTSFSGRPS